MTELRDIQLELEFARSALPGAGDQISFLKESGVGLLRKVADGSAERLRVGQAGQSEALLLNGDLGHG